MIWIFDLQGHVTINLVSQNLFILKIQHHININCEIYIILCKFLVYDLILTFHLEGQVRFKLSIPKYLVCNLRFQLLDKQIMKEMPIFTI